MKIIGLDISTSCTGYCIMEKNVSKSNLVEAGFISLSKEKDFYSKASKVKEFLEKIKKFHPDVSRVIVEENLQSFRPGFSSAKTILSLAKFNGVCCYLAEEVLCVRVDPVSVVHARSSVSLKVSRNSDLSTKDQVLNWVKNQPMFIDFDWPKKTFKRGPREGQTVDDSSCYDIADAAVVCMYGLNN